MSMRKFFHLSGFLSASLQGEGIEITPRGDLNSFTVPTELVTEFDEIFLDNENAMAAQARNNPESYKDMVEFKAIMRVVGPCSPSGGCVMNGETGLYDLGTLYSPKINLANDRIKAHVAKTYGIEEGSLPEFNFVLAFGNKLVPLISNPDDDEDYTTLDMKIEGMETAKVRFDDVEFGQTGSKYSMPLAMFTVGKRGDSRPNKFVAKIAVGKAANGLDDLEAAADVVNAVLDKDLAYLENQAKMTFASTGGVYSMPLTDEKIPYGRFPVIGARHTTSGKYPNSILELEGETVDGSREIFPCRFNRVSELPAFTKIQPIFDKTNPLAEKQHANFPETDGMKYFILYYGSRTDTINGNDGPVERVYALFNYEQMIPGEEFVFTRFNPGQCAYMLDQDNSQARSRKRHRILLGRKNGLTLETSDLDGAILEVATPTPTADAAAPVSAGQVTQMQAPDDLHNTEESDEDLAKTVGFDISVSNTTDADAPVITLSDTDDGGESAVVITPDEPDEEPSSEPTVTPDVSDAVQAETAGVDTTTSLATEEVTQSGTKRRRAREKAPVPDDQIEALKSDPEPSAESTQTVSDDTQSAEAEPIAQKLDPVAALLAD